MSNMTEKPARRASWTPPAVPEGNETRSSLRHLRDSLLKDDEVGITGLQKEMETRLSVFDTGAQQFHPKPRRRRGLSSMDSQQENPPNSTNTDIKAATSQSEYVLPWRPEVSQEQSLYLTMLPIKMPTAAHNKDGLPDSQTDDTFLNKIVDNHLICNICNKRYNQPKMLKCFHSFCSDCLSEKIQHQKTPMRTIHCPICVEDTPIPKNGVNDLQDNILLQDLLDDVSMHESCLVGQRSDDQAFLQESQKSSNETKILRVHTRSVNTYEVMSLKTERPLDPFLKDHFSGNFKKCLQHPNRNVTHFCKTCKKLICSNCMKSDHVPSQHHYVNAALAEEHAKKVMELLLDVIKQQKVEYVTSVNSLEDAYCRLHNMIRNTKKKISDQERYLIQKIKEKSAALQQEATQLGNERAEKIEEQHKKNCEGAKMASHNQDILEHAINEASQLEVLIAKEDVLKQCNEMIKKDAPKPMHKHSFLDFAEAQEGSNITMGHLLQTERWELQEELVEMDDKPFQQTGYIAMYSNGDIAVTDMLNWQLTVIQQDNNRCKRIEKSDKALVSPFAIAINKDDQLLVIDQNKVKVFDNQIKFLFEVPNSFPQYKNDQTTTPSIISCLAVDKQSKIAVGNRGKKAVCLHQQGGKLLRVLHADWIDTQMTMTNGERIIYSNYQERKLVSMTYKGSIVFCVSTADKSPTGVCCDAAGFIYVAVHGSFMGKCEIHQYSCTGEFIGCMVEGLNNPLAIIFTPRDKLAVADKSSVKIYRRV